MKQQIIVIHGGDTFYNYKDYISYLKNKEVSLDYFKIRKDWKEGLQETLGDSYEILAPKMPNSINARYEEWKIWFEKIIPFMEDELILIGHSLGGIFLAKYLSENNFSKKIKATILVSAPFDEENSEDKVNDFKLPSSLSKFTKQSETIYLIHSIDDPVVPFEQQAKYKKALPKAETIIFNHGKHFKQETFPEIVELIKKL